MPFSNSPTVLPDVTITVLDISLRLCTIPRSRLPETTHYVVKQFLRQSPTFMNITLNTSELSIFAEDSTLEDFLPLARRGRMGARSTAPVEISPDTWSVLQIDEDKFGMRPAFCAHRNGPLIIFTCRRCGHTCVRDIRRTS